MIREILIEARKNIATPEAWVKGASFACFNGDGNLTPCFRSEATCFCALGALQKAAGTDDFRVDLAVLDAANTLFDRQWQQLWHFNDHPATTHEMVLQAFDKAIHDAA